MFGEDGYQNLKYIVILIAFGVSALLLGSTVFYPYYLGIILIDLTILLAGAKFLRLFAKNQDDTHDEVPCPPDNFDSSQAGFVLDGYADDQDLVSLIIQWGNEGYLKIMVMDGDVQIVKLRKMDKKKSQWELFAQLFDKGGVARLSELNQNFFINMGHARQKLEAYFNLPENHLYYLESIQVQKIFSLLLIVPIMLCLMATYMKQLISVDLYEIVAILIVSGFIATSATIPMRTLFQILYHWNSMTMKKKVLKVSLVLAYGTAFLGLFMAYAYSVLPFQTIFTLVVTLVLIVETFFSRRKTEKGIEWSSRLLNLKHFINEAPRMAIIRLITEDPQYYYSILPYAYVMGISREWSEHFNEPELAPPVCSWFNTDQEQPQDVLKFHDQLMDALDKITLAMTSRPYIKISSGGANH